MGEDFPPLDVFFDEENYWLADGFMRYEAYAQGRFTEARCNVHVGTLSDAIIFAVQANDSHGLPRNKADRINAIMMFVSDPERAKLSNRQIADACRVHHKYVDDLFNNGKLNGEKIRVGKDGKERKHRPVKGPKKEKEQPSGSVEFNAVESYNKYVTGYRLVVGHIDELARHHKMAKSTKKEAIIRRLREVHSDVRKFFKEATKGDAPAD